MSFTHMHLYGTKDWFKEREIIMYMCIIINPYKMDSSRQNTVEKTGYLRSPSDKDPKI